MIAAFACNLRFSLVAAAAAADLNTSLGPSCQPCSWAKACCPNAVFENSEIPPFLVSSNSLTDWHACCHGPSHAGWTDEWGMKTNIRVILINISLRCAPPCSAVSTGGTINIFGQQKDSRTLLRPPLATLTWKGERERERSARMWCKNASFCYFWGSNVGGRDSRNVSAERRLR